MNLEYNEQLRQGDENISELAKIRRDLIKITYEYMGIDLGETKKNMEYKNYMIDNPLILGNSVGSDDIGELPSMHISSAQALANAKKILSILMTRLGLTKAQACGIIGVMAAESGINPASYNVKEKAGTYTSSRANGSGYGGGLIQWSLDRKIKALALIGKAPVPIESLSLEDQCEMLVRELQGPYKNCLTAIKQCNSAALAAFTFYTHNVGGYSNSTAPATKEQIDRMNAKYVGVGAVSQLNKGAAYAQDIFTKI